LNDLVCLFRQRLNQLDPPPIDHKLEIIYRSQFSVIHGAKKWVADAGRLTIFDAVIQKKVAWWRVNREADGISTAQAVSQCQ
jgi:hypothetical protein